MSHFIELDRDALGVITGGEGIDNPTAPSLSDLRAASNNGMGIGPPSSNIAPAPAPIQILGAPFAVPGGGIARFGR